MDPSSTARFSRSQVACISCADRRLGSVKAGGSCSHGLAGLQDSKNGWMATEYGFYMVYSKYFLN